MPGIDTAPAPHGAPPSPDVDDFDKIDIGDFHVPEDLSGEDLGDLSDLNKDPYKDVPEHLNPALIEPVKAVLAGLDESALRYAREAAHEKLARRERKGPIYKRIAKSIWHTMTREYQLVKGTQEAMAAIVENDNLRHHQGKDDTAWREATTRRFASEYGEAMIHAEAGEKYHNLSDPEKADDPNVKRMRAESEDLLARYARGEIPDRKNFDLQLKEMTKKWADEGISQDLIGEGKMSVNNFGDAAEQVKAQLNAVEGLSAVDKEVRLQAILAQTEIVLGEAMVGSNVEIGATMAERIAEKMKGVPILKDERFAKVAGFLQNPLIMGAMVAGGLATGKKVLAHLAPGLGAGLAAAINEYQATLADRALMERREDNDLGADAKSKRQLELEAAKIESRPSEELVRQIGDLYNEHGELDFTDEAGLKRGLEMLGEIKARIKIYDRGRRVISFTDGSSKNMADNRFDLDLAVAKLETDLGKLYENSAATVVLGIEPGQTFEADIKDRIDMSVGAIEKRISAQDRIARKIAADRAAFKFVTVAATTLLTAGLAKYAGHVVSHIADAIRDHWGGPNTVGEMIDSQTAPEMVRTSEEMPLGDATEANIPGEYGDVGFTEADVPTDYGEGGLSESSTADYEAAANETDIPVEYGEGVNVGMNEADIPVEYGASGSNDDIASGRTGRVEPDIPTEYGKTPLKEPDIPTEYGQPVREADIPVEYGAQKEADIPVEYGADSNAAVHEADVPVEYGGETQNGGELKVTETTTINLPEGFTQNAVGEQLVITSPGGESFTATLNPDGSLSQESITQMETLGYKVIDHPETVPGPPIVTKETVTVTEFINNHQSQMKPVEVEVYMDNGNPESNLNEFGLNNTANKDGSVTVSISGMTENGSFHGKSGVNWREANAQGRVMLYMSASKDSQVQCFEVQFDQNGNIHFPADSPGRAFFDNKGNFLGGYERAAVVGDVTPDGVTHVASLATEVGKNSKEFTDTITTPTFKEAHSYTITPPNNMSEQSATLIEAAPSDDYPFPGFPVWARRRLGGGEDRRPPTPPSPGTVRSTPGGPAGPGVTPPGGRPRSAGPNPNSGPNFTPGNPGAPRNGGPGVSSPPGGVGSPPNGGPATNTGTGPAGGYSYPSADPAANIPPDGGGTTQAKKSGNAASSTYSSPFGTPGTNNSQKKANDNQTVYTPQERTVLDKIDAEAQTALDPPSEMRFDLAGLDPYAAKIVRVAYNRTIQSMNADNTTKRQAFESDQDWYQRVLKTMEISAEENREPARMSVIPVNLKPLFQAAYTEIVTAFARTQGYTASGRRPSN